MNNMDGSIALCSFGCRKDDDAIYYPVGNVDIERGGVASGRWKGRIGSREL